MAGHPQSDRKGLWQKDQIDVNAQSITGNSTAIKLSGGIALSGDTKYVTANSTAVKFTGGVALSGGASYVTANSTASLVLTAGIRVSNKKYITANSTGFILTAVAAKPTADNGAAFTMISNSTGVALAINSTGGTWKYLLTTSVQPT